MVRIFLFSFLRDYLISIFWVFWAVSFLTGGKSVSQAAFVLGTFFTCSAFLEYPTGVFADRYGRKLSSLIGIVLLGLGFLCNIGQDSWALSLLAFPVSALGITFLSGASTVWLSNSTEQSGRMKGGDFVFLAQIFGRFSMILASFLGGWIFDFGNRYLWTSSAVAAVFTFAIGCTVSEQRISDRPEDLRTVVKLGLQSMKSPVIFWMIAGAAIYGIESGIRNIIWTPYILSFQMDDHSIVEKFSATLAVIRLFGLITFRYFVKNQVQDARRAYWPLIAGILAFSAAELNATFATSYLQFILPYAASMFVLGWYFAFRDIILLEVTDKTCQASVFSFASLVENGVAASACFVLSLTLTVGNVRTFWAVGGMALFVAAVAYLASAASFGKFWQSRKLGSLTAQRSA